MPSVDSGVPRSPFGRTRRDAQSEPETKRHFRVLGPRGPKTREHPNCVHLRGTDENGLGVPLEDSAEWKALFGGSRNTWLPTSPIEVFNNSNAAKARSELFAEVFAHSMRNLDGAVNLYGRDLVSFMRKHGLLGGR